MNQQYLTKLATTLVKKREKRAALWDKLIRTGQLSGKSLETIFQRALFPGGRPSISNLSQKGGIEAVKPWFSSSFQRVPDKVDEIVKMFPHRSPTKQRSVGWLHNLLSRSKGYMSYAPHTPAIRKSTTAVQGDLVRMLRQLNQPAKPYAPMEGILKQLAELKKAKGKMAPSSKLNKARFKGLQESGQRLKPSRAAVPLGAATRWRPLK